MFLHRDTKSQTRDLGRPFDGVTFCATSEFPTKADCKRISLARRLLAHRRMNGETNCGEKQRDEEIRHGRSSASRRARAALAGRPNDSAGHRHRREHRGYLWARGASYPSQRSVLVSGVRLCTGDGLAFFGNYNICDGSAEARTESTLPGAWSGCVWRTRPAFCTHTRGTPLPFLYKTNLDGEALARTSRLTARIDNNAVADGFQLYLHSFVILRSGEWAVVQQGMNPQNRLARRYHWHSAAVRDFVSDPHTAIVGKPQGTILNLVDGRAAKAQQALLTITREPIESSLNNARKLTMPAHHEVRAKDIDLKRLGAVLAVAHQQDLCDFASLLLLEALGPRTLQSLALIAEVVHGAPSRFSDPARFSFAHGGKDGHPFPVPLKTYDESLAVLRRSLAAARLGHTEKVEGFKRLDRLTRTVERDRAPVCGLRRRSAHEQSISASLGGRTVFDDKLSRRRPNASSQLRLFG